MRPQNELLNDQQKEENPVKWLAEKNEEEKHGQRKCGKAGKTKNIVASIVLSCE